MHVNESTEALIFFSSSFINIGPLLKEVATFTSVSGLISYVFFKVCLLPILCGLTLNG